MLHQVANGKFRNCVGNYIDARCQIPDARGFTKWQIANGKWQIKGLRL